MKIKQSAAVALLGLTAYTAHGAAHGADNIFRLGATHVALHSKAPDLSSNGPAFLTPQPSGVTVGDAETVTLGYTRRLDPHWDIDLLLGIPPTHTVNGTGKLAPFGDLARIKQAAPTVLLTYNFFAPERALRPFAGLGVNYTHFYDSTSSAANNLASGGPTRIQLSDSTGLAGYLGLSWQMNKEWALTASIAAARVETDMTTMTGSIERKTTVDLRPVVFTLGVAYGF